MRKPGSVWHLSMEIVVMGDKVPGVRDHLAKAQREGARGIIPMLMGGLEEDVPEEDVDTLGQFYMTLMMGLIAQWTFDPETATSAEALTEGLRRVIAGATAAGAGGGGYGSGVVLTILPSRISATRSQKWRTSAMSWQMNR